MEDDVPVYRRSFPSAPSTVIFLKPRFPSPNFFRSASSSRLNSSLPNTDNSHKFPSESPLQPNRLTCLSSLHPGPTSVLPPRG